jgi:hypothetical protein
MNNYDPNDILKFRFFFTSVNKHHNEENLKFKEKTYDDIENFVKNILDNSGNDQEYIGGMLENFTIELLQKKVGLDISVIDHKNAYHIQNFILEYFGKLVAKNFQPLEIHEKYSIRQIVWLFKVLQENKVVLNYSVDLIRTLSALLNHPVATIKTYISTKDETEEGPPCIFPGYEWDNLFK